ncbi:MAG: alpha/beta hydrolase, partial [Dehalococcoidia bacterium]
VSVACEYRLSGEAKWPAQVHDVKAALRWMRANADSLGLDPERIAVSGNSAGGHLSLMVGATPNLPEFEGEGGNAGVPTDVAAVISFYPPVHIGGPAGEVAPGSMQHQLVGGAATAEAILRAGPLPHVTAAFPPTMLIHGGEDELVPVSESLDMYRALVKAGVKAELHVYAGQPHGFDATPALGRQSAELMALFMERYVPAREAAPA